MKKQTICIIGGHKEQTYKKIGSKNNCTILFHDGKARNGGVKKVFRTYVKKADCVVVLGEACGHETMYSIKDLCKESKTKVVFHDSIGASGAIAAGLERIKAVA